VIRDRSRNLVRPLAQRGAADSSEGPAGTRRGSDGRRDHRRHRLRVRRHEPIFIALPFVFITIACQLPAGLLVYWITTNTWTIVQGAIVRKRLGHLRQAAHDAQAAVGRRGGLGDLLFKQLLGQDPAEPPPSDRRPRS
jgi:hypothetical protein